MFLGTMLPVPDLEHSLARVTIGPHTVECIDGHNRVVGAASLNDFQYHLKLKDHPPQLGVRRHYSVIPQCAEMIASYRAASLS